MDQIPAPAANRRSPRIRFVTVARISSEKGYPGLIQAFQRLILDGVDAELVIVGDGPLRGAIEANVAAESVAKRITFLGALSEPGTLEQISRADVFVLSSLMEGLPVVLMEAMALGRATVAPAVAGIPELIRDKENGLLFRPADWNALFDCMLLLANDAPLRNTLGAAGRRTVQKEFDMNTVIEPLVSSFGFPVGEGRAASNAS